MEFRPVTLDSWNEADVREELLAPLLKHLGYAKGGDNNIIREQPLSLRYAKNALGRKKPTDPDVRGQPDYICEVTFPSGRIVRWILEAKSPSEQLGEDAIEQAFSYSNHQEVCAIYFCLSNGREFRLYQTNSGTQSPAIFQATYEGLSDNLSTLENLLLPDSIRRDCKDVTLDPGKPIGKGLRSLVQIVGGYIEHQGVSPALPSMHGLTIPIVNGAVERTPDGRLLGYFCTRSPFAQIQRTIDRLGLGKFEALSQDTILSLIPDKPTVFNAVHEYSSPKGEKLYDFRQGVDVSLPVGLTVRVTTTASGHLKDNTFLGTFRARQEFLGFSFPSYELTGAFQVLLA